MKACVACNQPNADDAQFCIHCGLTLRQAGAPGTVPASPASAAIAGGGPAPVAVAEPIGLAAGPLAPGTLVDQKYAVERQLGEGGMGVVYLARDIHTQTPVVIKAIRSEYAHRQEFRDRTLAEGRALARIDHPNVVRLNAVVVEPGALYLVMQFVEGESLEQRIGRHAQARTPLPTAEALGIFRQVLEGVAAAHREGVIHRDLKPGNILIRARDGAAKVTDFGIAKGEEEAKAGRGQTRGIIGSLLYMAPEQVTGRKDLDKRVDIYSLGIVLFELLMGRVPFDAPSEFEIMKLHVEGRMPSVCAARPEVPGFVDELLARACAKDRDQRFASAEQFVAALDRGMAAAASAAQGPWQAPPAPAAWQPAHPLVAPQAPVAAAPPVAASTAEQALTATVPDRAGGSRGGALVAIGALLGLVVLGGAGLAGAWALGWIGGAAPIGSATVAVPPSAPAGRDAAPPEAAPPPSPLAALAGAWRSESGRDYDAVTSGDVLEFRIRDARQFGDAGYVDGESRFTLGALAGEQGTFVVEDKLRPSPPLGLRYELPRARATCQEIWTSVDRKPLRAQFDGKRLTVDMVKVVPEITMFEVQAGKVVGCKRLSEAKSSRIEITYTRP